MSFDKTILEKIITDGEDNYIFLKSVKTPTVSQLSANEEYMNSFQFAKTNPYETADVSHLDISISSSKRNLCSFESKLYICIEIHHSLINHMHYALCNQIQISARPICFYFRYSLQ